MNLGHVALICLLAGTLPATAAPSASEAAAAGAVLRQETLPALSARQTGAEARAEAALRWFSGEGALAAAWPALARLPLEDRGVLDGQIDAIETAMMARAAERVAAPPAGLDDAEQARWRRVLDAALAAEDAADSLDLRLLAALRAGAARAPGLADPDGGARLRALQAARTAATSGRAPGDPGWDEAAAEASRIGAAEAALQGYRSAARRAHAIPGDPTLSALVDADIAAIQAGTADEPASLDRLERALPLLDDARQARVQTTLDDTERRLLTAEIARLRAGDAAREAALQSVGREPLPEPLEVYEAAVAQAERSVRAATAEAAALEAEGSDEATGLPAVRAEAARLRRSKAEIEAELARRRRDRAARIAELGLDGADVTEAEVDAARAAAAEAREAAQAAAATAADASARFTAQVSDMSDSVVTLLEERKRRSEAAQAVVDDLEEQLGRARTAYAEADALPPLAKGRSRRLAEAYGMAAQAVRSAQAEVRARAVVLDRLIDTDALTLSAFPEPDPVLLESFDVSEVDRWRDARGSLVDEIALRDRTARAEVASALRVLDELRDARRLMRPEASDTELERDAQGFFDELGNEVANVPVRGAVWWWTAQRARGGSGLPDIATLLRGSMEALIILTLWFLGRRRIGGWTRTVLDAAAATAAPTPVDIGGFSLRSMVVPGDPRRAHAPLVLVLGHALDVLAAWLVGALLWDDLPAASVPLLLLAAVQGGRLGVALLSLLLGETDDDRPSLARLAPEVRRRAVSSAALAVSTFVGLRATGWLATEILMTDRIADLIRTTGTLLGVGVLILLLVRWEPDIRTAVASGDQTRVTEFLLRPGRSRLVQGARAALGLLVLSQRSITRLGGRLIESRAGLAWLRAALARQRLKDSQGAPARRLPEASRARVLAACHTAPPREAELAQLRAGLVAWRDGGEPGMLALTSDRGSGKSRLLTRLMDEFAEDGEVLRLEPPHHLTDADTALAWLADALGCAPDHPPDDAHERAEQLIEQLSALPPRIVLIDESHKLFLRAVGGFDALRRVLEVLHATSRQHLWICAFHEPAWHFLSGISERVNLAVFRRSVTLRPLAPEALAEWLEERTRAAGFTLDYSDLVSGSPSRTDPARVEARARDSFWRLLTDEAQGNPLVARGYWLSALSATDDADRIRVGLFHTPQVTELADLSAQDLFLLTAVIIHDGLSIRHLTEVLNLAPGVCRAIGRRLDARGLLEADASGNRYTVHPGWAPGIQRVLRSKQFLHGGGR